MPRKPTNNHGGPNEPADDYRGQRRLDSYETTGEPVAVDFERQQPSGRFAPEDVAADRSVSADRAPDGRFVSPLRESPEIGRRPSDGQFTDLSEIDPTDKRAADQLQAAKDELLGAPEPNRDDALMARAAAADVSLSPREAVGNVMDEWSKTDAGGPMEARVAAADGDSDVLPDFHPDDRDRERPFADDLPVFESVQGKSLFRDGGGILPDGRD